MSLPQIVTINENNIDSEHICCAIGDKKHEYGLSEKKKWMKDRFREGFVFKKAAVRGKAFIQYGPAENAWAPIKADGYMFIECFWVSGQFAGKGIGKRLLEECMYDAKNKKGIAVIVGSKKKPFLNDKAFFKKAGFVVCDIADPYFELMVLKNNLKEDNPVFNICTKSLKPASSQGLVIYYSNGCPFTEYYLKETERLSKENGLAFKAIKVATKEDAQNLPVAFSLHRFF